MFVEEIGNFARVGIVEVAPFPFQILTGFNKRFRHFVVRFLAPADNREAFRLCNAFLPVFGIEPQAEQKRFSATGTLFGTAHFLRKEKAN